jgi:hypothetical protein
MGTTSTKVTLVNLTKHDIVIMLKDQPDVRIRPSGTVARVPVQHQDTIEYVSAGGLNIPIKKTARTPGTVVDLPDPVPGYLYLVSRLVAEAYPERTDLAIPNELIRDAFGTIIGCRSLARPGVES